MSITIVQKDKRFNHANHIKWICFMEQIGIDKHVRDEEYYRFLSVI
jgi:hypothetical protein